MSEFHLPPQLSKLILPWNTPLTDTQLRQGLKVEKSPIEGMGLFADRDFALSAIIWQETLQGRGAKPENGGPLRWANHSDDPNSVLILRQHEGLHVTLMATKSILQHQEITYNYNVFGHSGHRAECKCGETSCNGFFLLREEWGEKR